MRNAIKFAFTGIATPLKTARQRPQQTCIQQECSRALAVPTNAWPQRNEAAANSRIAETLQRIRASAVVLCIRLEDANSALSAARAALRGGIQCIEMTLTTPHAPALIAQLRAEYPTAVIGAGTVLTPRDADSAASAGALFAMSPATNGDVIRTAHEHDMLAIPGTATASEITHAYHDAGAHVVKVFPVALCGGLQFVKAMQGPLGHIPLLPTSGVETALVPQFLKEGNVLAVGASHQVVTREAVLAQDWEAVTRNAQHWTDMANKCRIHSLGLQGH